MGDHLMARFAIIKDGVTVNIVQAEADFAAAQGWVPATTDHVIGQGGTPTVPVEVTMRQARLALLGSGKLALVAPAIDALPEPQRTAAQIEWEYSAMVERNRPFVLTLGAALGLSAAQLDQLFIVAATL
ncbi:MAG: hypothetical protein EOO22_10755 [Comamonadaceae bacterium]|nr:MAG: hypothetical protein EOO22_10755 [Comamonadaceae bacterium]